jgi:hypothetical protein
MRTALVLLFLLALGSVPGSVLPQEGIDPQAVQQYYAAHPSLAPLLARLSLFNVFASPWFAAVYLLLFASLAGCVIPRTFRLAGSARQPPPQAPANLSRLPLTARYETTLAPDEALAAAAAVLSAKRFRLRTGDGTGCWWWATRSRTPPPAWTRSIRAGRSPPPTCSRSRSRSIRSRRPTSPRAPCAGSRRGSTRSSATRRSPGPRCAATACG